MAPAPGAGPTPTPKPAAGGNFRETLWFKKGDVDQMVEDARERVEAARAKGRRSPTPTAWSRPPRPESTRRAQPVDDSRYVDDGSLTAEDRKKFSLRSGGDVDGVADGGGGHARRADERRRGDGRDRRQEKLWIIAIAVVVAALLGIFFVRKMTAKDVSKSAAAMTPPTIPTTEPPPSAPAPPTPPVAAVKPPAPTKEAAKDKDGDEPTPKASSHAAAKKHVAAKKTKGKKAHKYEASGFGPRASGFREVGRPLGDRARDVVNRGARVDGDRLQVACDQRPVGRRDPLLNRVGVVALLGAAGGPAPGGGDRHRQIEQQRQVGRANVARQLRHPFAFRLLPLVGERRQQISVADHVHPGGQRGLDLAAQVVAAIGGEQERHRAPVGGAAVGQAVPAQQDLAQQPAHRPGARLARRVHAAPARRQVVGQAPELRRGPRTVDSLENDEEWAGHLRLRLPRSTRFWA